MMSTLPIMIWNLATPDSDSESDSDIEGCFDIEAFDIEGCFDIEYTTFDIELFASISKYLLRYRTKELLIQVLNGLQLQ